MKVYIAGPMLGDPDYKEKFNEAEKYLKALGHDVINPVRLAEALDRAMGAEPCSLPRRAYMEADIMALLQCDKIAMLRGFNRSAGAMLEFMIATELGLDIIPIKTEKEEE